MKPVRVGRAPAIGGVKAEEPQDAQVILGDAHRRVPDEAYPVLLEILDAADRVVHRAVARDRERVEREIAAFGVLLPAAAEPDFCLAPERLDVLAQRRDLEAGAVDHDRDRTVLDAGRHRPEARRLRAPHHRLGQRRRGDIDIAGRMPEQHVSHRAADHARLLTVAVEHCQQLRQRALRQPCLVVQPHRVLHRCIAPGTNFPFSMCAGT